MHKNKYAEAERERESDVKTGKRQQQQQNQPFASVASSYIFLSPCFRSSSSIYYSIPKLLIELMHRHTATNVSTVYIYTTPRSYVRVRVCRFAKTEIISIKSATSSQYLKAFYVRDAEWRILYAKTHCKLKAVKKEFANIYTDTPIQRISLTRVSIAFSNSFSLSFSLSINETNTI